MAKLEGVLYVCNRKRCGDRCSFPQCSHTTEKEFAEPGAPRLFVYSKEKGVAAENRATCYGCARKWQSVNGCPLEPENCGYYIEEMEGET